MEYKIIRIINNNIVCSIDEKGREIILRGLGIGFNRKKNDFIDDDKVEKIYKISNHSDDSKEETLLADIPDEYIEISTQLVDYTKSVLTQKLSGSFFVSLTDHIHFAVKRYQDKISYTNPLMWEIRKFYPTEFMIAKHGLAIVNKELGIQLPQDEAGFIALHIVNAELDTEMSNTVMITELIQSILEIVKEYYKKDFDEESVDFERFLTHLKFLGQRLVSNDMTGDGKDEILQDMIKKRYAKEYECAVHIHDYVQKRYNIDFGEEEKMYLTIHLKRVSEHTL